AKGIELRRAGIPDGYGALLMGDPVRIRQVLLNLTNNAVKFTERGSVTIETRVTPDRDEQARLRVRVVDTGIGIRRDSLEPLFQPFTQADASTTRRYGGTGLGLSISKRLIQCMGGRIGATSTVGVGSEFWFEVVLPVVGDRHGIADSIPAY